MESHGFTLVREQTLNEVGGTARLWKHSGSGAELLSISNQDENKCFGVTFFTPPTDSTGVAHILEHSVLCGSDRFPVKEPFVELLKGSLQTFLNAFTFPDKTCYPVASANLRDFYNLIDVYLDAVFHPLLNEDIFKQEGWHIEADSLATPWTYKGVVYNEMKGVYSSPDSVLAEQTQQAVFPDNLYCLDSGGNPEVIPSLTYQAFCDFHHRYYQPGNARFFFWGDDPEEERLRIVDACIAGALPVTDLPGIRLQRSREKPASLEIPYAAAKGEERGLCTVSWLLGERGDLDLALRLEMLEHILEGMPGSPLRRALMESGLGEDTTGCGLETDLRQMYYATGLKGIHPDDAGKVEDLTISVLRNLADNGIDPDAIAAAVNSVEFAYRENNSGRFPRGLSAMIQSLSTWLYGEDPIAALAWEKPLDAIKHALARGEKVFEKVIRDHFLNNTHRVRVSLIPDESLGSKREEAEKARLAMLQAQASEEAREEIVRETRRLVAAQLAEDSPEDLARIPMLGVQDLPARNKDESLIEKHIPQVFLAQDLPTNGIAYVSFLMPISHIPATLLPWLPLFCRTLTEWGTQPHNFVELGVRIASATGGLSALPITGARLAGAPYAWLGVSGKATYDHLEDLFGLLEEILAQPQQDVEVRLRRLAQMLLEEKARLENVVQVAAHAAASTRVRAHFTGEGALLETLSGISQLEFVRRQAARLEKEGPALLQELEELRGLVVGARGSILNCTADARGIALAEPLAGQLVRALPAASARSAGSAIADWKGMADLARNEAFITPGQINFVGWGGNTYKLGYKYSGAANVIMRWLRMGRLWEEVRVAGGAYGVFCALDRISGTLVCSSYRDPGVDSTLVAFEGLAGYLRSFTPTQKQLSQAIVGAVGEVDTYLLPDARGMRALGWYLAGLTPEIRQQAREEMLATTAADFRQFADVLGALAPTAATCIIGGTATAQAARQHGWKEQALL